MDLYIFPRHNNEPMGHVFLLLFKNDTKKVLSRESLVVTAHKDCRGDIVGKEGII